MNEDMKFAAIDPGQSYPLSAIRRDVMAAFALAGFLSQRGDSEESDHSLTFLAQLSYRMADAMISEASVDRKGGK